MSIQDERVLNRGHKEAGSEYPAYCRGDNQLINKDEELLMKIMQRGYDNMDNRYIVAKEILKYFKRREGWN